MHLVNTNKLGSKLKNIFTFPFLLLLITFSYFIYHSHNHNAPAFVVPSGNNCIIKSKIKRCTTKEQFTSEIIPQPPFLAASHAATLEILPNGNLLALWFAGSHEGKPDVKIWQSTFDGESWSMAHEIVSPQLLTKTTNTYVKKVGNPVVYVAPNGVVHLFVISVSLIGGWSASNLNHFISTDMATTWSGGERLILTPFFNISTLVRTNPIALKDGGFYLPVYHELIQTYPELLRFDQNGNFIEQIKISGHNSLIQPSILVLNDKDAVAFMRNHNRVKVNNKLYYQTTNDGGFSWHDPEVTNLTNQDSSLVVARIESLQYLMVHNISGRNKLSLAISNDFSNWHDIYALESGTLSQEFSYPAIKIHDGIVDVLYTWDRLAIKHVQFSLSWLSKQTRRSDDTHVN